VRNFLVARVRFQAKYRLPWRPARDDVSSHAGANGVDNRVNLLQDIESIFRWQELARFRYGFISCSFIGRIAGLVKVIETRFHQQKLSNYETNKRAQKSEDRVLDTRIYRGTL